MIWCFFYRKLKAKSVNTYTCSCYLGYKWSVLEILGFLYLSVNCGILKIISLHVFIHVCVCQYTLMHQLIHNRRSDTVVSLCVSYSGSPAPECRLSRQRVLMVFPSLLSKFWNNSCLFYSARKLPFIVIVTWGFSCLFLYLISLLVKPNRICLPLLYLYTIIPQ